MPRGPRLSRLCGRLARLCPEWVSWGASGSEGRHEDPVAKETASLALREPGTSLRGLGRLRGAVLGVGEPEKGGERARRFSP